METMATMATINSDLFLHFKKELRLNVINYLFYIKYFTFDLKFYEKLVAMANKKNAYYFFVKKRNKLKFAGQI